MLWPLEYSGIRYYLMLPETQSFLPSSFMTSKIQFALWEGTSRRCNFHFRFKKGRKKAEGPGNIS